MLGDFLGRGLSHASETQESQAAHIIKSFKKSLEKDFHAMRAGENNPVVGAELGKNITHGPALDIRHHADQRQLQHLGTEMFEFAT